MHKMHFQLTLEPNSDDIILLLQLSDFCAAADDGSLSKMPPFTELSEAFKKLFPQTFWIEAASKPPFKSAENWEVEAGKDKEINIVTRDEGARLSHVMSVIEMLTPSALESFIIYRPGGSRTSYH